LRASHPRASVHTVQGAGQAPQPVWSLYSRDKYFAPGGNRTPVIIYILNIKLFQYIKFYTVLFNKAASNPHPTGPKGRLISERKMCGRKSESGLIYDIVLETARRN
jgi:hypothetical protein